jgi:hypothetical protein
MFIAVIGAVLAAGCARGPISYAMPPQRSLDLGQNPGGRGAWVAMDDPAAAEYIVRDVSPQPDHHRWAFAHPEFRFRLPDAGYSKFAAEFAIPSATFRTTGPVTIQVAVNGVRLEPFRCDHAGDYRLERTVPATALASHDDVRVTFETSPLWVSPEDGAQLSFYLKAAGFLR